jgi:tetratricopeptide (TPR) repeat protein
MNESLQRLSFLLFSLLFLVVGVYQTSGRADGQTSSASGSQLPTVRGDKTRLDHALQLFRNGKFDEASQEYSAIHLDDPQTAEALVGLVRVYLKQKKIAEAYDTSVKAQAIDPHLDAVRAVMGEVYFRQGKLVEAEREFFDLAKANTKEARAYLGLARVDWAASNYRLAKADIDRAYRLDPADPDIRKAWIHTLNRKERQDALAAYLASPGNDDEEERRSLESTLDLYKDDVRPCSLATAVTNAEINLDALLIDQKHLRGYGLGVKVNGVSSKLLVDTGAAGILINRNTAEKAGIKPITRQELKGVGDKGAAGGFVGYADSVKIGSLEFHNCLIRVLEKSSVTGRDGIIGADFFDDFLVDLDFPHEKLKLSQLPPRPGDPAPGTEESSTTVKFYDRYVSPEMRSFTPVYRFGHALLVNTQLNDLPPKLFLIDTGAFDNIISTRAAREVTGVSSDSEVTVKGISGKVENVFRANKFTIQFGRLRQRNQDTIAFDTKRLSDSLGTEVSGMLGFALLTLTEIKIDYRDGLVDFIYNYRPR